jgi:hydroxyethylthiazole kinase-like uncharacterized protein yjeF
LIKTLNALALTSALKRKDTAHKGDCGKVLLIGGAPSMAGALTLAAKSALYSGAGWTVLMMFDSACAHLISDQPELMIHDAHSVKPEEALRTIQPDVVAIGPGLGQSALAHAWLRTCLHWEGSLIVDADALNLVASDPSLLERLQNRTHATTLTPHPGEAARLLACSPNDIQLNRERAVRHLTELTRCIVVLKGHQSLVHAPHCDVLMCNQGNPGMAVGGMGDVLTGCIAALAAQGVHHALSLWQATCLGVQVHACAADLMLKEGTGPIGMTPSELLVYVRQVLNHEFQHLRL